ncbi:hypothetical protein [Mycolicibacterium pulveris]|uniref:hypothetical protein n=1 Tax=Mycolicibacterium pulveris TaxID=36813 RepID=UPI003CF4FB5F
MNHDDEPDPASARVREELARLGADEASAPEVPGEVTARIGAALRAADPGSSKGPAHTLRRPRLGRLQLLGLLAGGCAAVAGVVIGVAMLSADDPPAQRDPGPTARSITVTPPRHNMPLSDAEIVALRDRPPDYGPLTDAQQRASCLAGLGYPAVTPLGARPVDIAGRPAVLLLLPGGTADGLVAVAVAPDCTAAQPGLLAHTVLARP